MAAIAASFAENRCDPCVRFSSSMPPAKSETLLVDRSHETTTAGISWVAFARCRGQFISRWPSVFRMPLRPDHHALLTERGLPLQSYLDVGATDRVHEPKVRAAWRGIDYRSFDIDRTNQHDYYDFAAVDRQFDAVTLLEVLEHLPPKVAVELMGQCFRACKSGGWFLASVPNVYTPGSQEEWTHISTLHYLDLLGLTAWAGFEVVQAARVYYGSWRHQLVHAKLLHPLHRVLGVDYAQSIVVLAKKP